MTHTIVKRTTRSTRTARRWLLALALGLAVPTGLLEPDAAAQRTTATITVNVSAGGGAAPAGVTVVAMSTETGAATLGTARSDSSHVVTGLAPGEYLITATPPGGKETYRLVQVEVGQTLTLDLDLGDQAVESTSGETIVVEGRVSDISSSEIATNVTRDQIDNLPQNNRNFLNFATLAPGVRLSQDEFRQELTSGALGASQTNVFVDGISLKSNVQQGGLVGQDASRGNPFPQLAVGGFRVITQNYKAEYEQAGSAIISAITQSGTNEYHGSVLTQFQQEQLTATDYFIKKRGDAEPDLSRYQVGAAASGPIVPDKAFIFLTYEGNYQQRQNQVFLTGAPPELADRFDSYEGVFTSPFREHLGFGKVTWRPADNQNVEVSSSLRLETDIRSFGNDVSFEAAENVKNRVITAAAKHQIWIGSLLNEATFQYLENHFAPQPENAGLVGQQFFAGGLGSASVIRVGGRDTTQDNGQRGFTLRDDVTFSDIEGAGQHVIKTGAKGSFMHYTIDKQLNGNPLFRYFNDPATGLTYDIPAEASYGVGDPLVESNNVQAGLYVQDDWQVHKQLTLNLGIRWDIETNPLNNDYVTPNDVRMALTQSPYSYTTADPDGDGPGVGDTLCDAIPFDQCIQQVNGADFFESESYITDGSDRPIYLGAIQPRLGLAYDVFGDHATTLFAGAGRYYDRTLFNDGVDERYRLQYETRTFLFTPTADDSGRIVWDPSYLSKAGLDQLIAQGTAPGPEIYLLDNDIKPLHTDQLSGGVRQVVGPLTASGTVTYAMSKNGLGYYPANRVRTGTRDFMPAPEGFGNVILATDQRESRYTSLQVSLEKPLNYEWSDYGIAWGASAAYTLAWAKEKGDVFNFDYANIEDSPWVPTANDERQRLVLTGIAKLPYEFTLSSLIQLGTGLPFTIVDESAGTSADLKVVRRNGGRDDKFLEFRQVDLRIGKDFSLGAGHRIGAFVECFNVFNSKNFGGQNGSIFFMADNPDFGRPSRLVAPPRAFQLGAQYNF